MDIKRIIIVVLDSVGIGAMPDSAEYGDIGANTLGNVARHCKGLKLYNLEKLGLGCIAPIEGLRKVEVPLAAFGKMAEVSKGKDTTTGHWELAGCVVKEPFPVYPDGFSPEVIESFTKYTGLEVLGNIAASGTEIIAKLGEEHMLTGKPIFYTSADSVFQIAAHEEIIPLERLYELCKIAREKVCVGKHAVGRIIARPFIGTPGNFVRTANRHDYSLAPLSPTVLDKLREKNLAVIAVGKIADIFAHQGISETFPTTSNEHGMTVLSRLVTEESKNGIIMVNLVDFDMKFGHRNDPEGYGRALEQFDVQLGLLLQQLSGQDLLIITADHGCDPTAPGTDHTREYVPLLAYRVGMKTEDLGIRSSFADVAATIAENFSLGQLEYGTSFLYEILR